MNERGAEMGKIRVGEVGLGGISTGVHLPGIDRSPDLELTAICDIDEAALKACQEKYGIDDAHCFRSYQDLIACPDVDAVDIATPNDVHFEIAKAAIEAGKPYSLEKPITMNSAQADELARLTKEKGLRNMICFSYRFKAAARYARDLVARGLLGEIYHVDMQYFQAWGLPDKNTPLVWRFVKERTGSGALGDLGCHGLDLVRFVTGREYTKVVGHAGTYVGERAREDGGGSGKVDVDDFCNYMTEMEGGISTSFQITRFAFGRGNYQRMEIYGSRGALVYMLDQTPDTDELQVCFGAACEETHTFTPVPIPNQYKADQMQSFADIILGRGDGLPATIADGQKNQHVVDAILASCEQGKWVCL